MVGIASIIFAADGNLSKPKNMDVNLERMAGWNGIRQVTIGAADIDLITAYPNMMCCAFKNESASDGTVKVFTVESPADTNDINLISHETSGLLPTLSKIGGTTTGSTAILITLYFFKR